MPFAKKTLRDGQKIFVFIGLSVITCYYTYRIVFKLHFILIFFSIIRAITNKIFIFDDQYSNSMKYNHELNLRKLFKELRFCILKVIDRNKFLFLADVVYNWKLIRLFTILKMNAISYNFPAFFRHILVSLTCYI